LVRDRFGIKPLYFAQDRHEMIFASELTPLLSLNKGMGEIDLEAVHAYIALSYVPGHKSIIQGIDKVSPAERIVWERGQCTRQIYWEPQPIPLHMTRAKATEALAEQLDHCVHSQLVSDVPVAAFLSGGVDSSTIVAMARRHTDIQTFCVSFEESGMDESPIAKTIATHLGTRHHEVVIPLDPVSLLFQAIEFMDEPFADSSALPTFAISQAVKHVAKVVLSGDGGDEVFGGYTGRYRVPALGAVIPYPALVAKGIRSLPPWRFGRRRSLPEMLELASFPDEERYVLERQITTPSQRTTLFDVESLQQWEADLRDIPKKAIAHAREWHPVHRALWIDLTTSLPNDMLTKVDRMSMAHGLEVRVPFLQHRLVEFALSLPAHWLVSATPVEGKRLLRDVVTPLLPPGILNRPKQGFCIPLNQWIKTHYSTLFDDVCLSSDSQIGAFFPRKVLQGIRRASLDGTGREGLYALLVLELWLRRWANMRRERVQLSHAFSAQACSAGVP